jgi:hypothetical protein
MLAYGATFELTPREKGMNGAIARARELVATTPGAWMPQQFDNPANIEIHARTTAEEIAADFPSGVDALITGVGTGGHITGCARVLKKMWPRLKVWAVEPSASPVISGGKPSPHPIQGIGAGFIPKNLQWRCSTARSRSRPRRRARWRGAAPARRASWSASPRRDARGDRPEAARDRARIDRARLQLRHRREVPFDRRFPAS